MTHYLILAEGGCYGHFLACVIRSMWNLKFTEQAKISNSGSCDFISGANSIFRLIQQVHRYTVYPENAPVAEHIVRVLETKEYMSLIEDEHLNYDHLNTFHYIKNDSVDKFLTVDNVKIIYVVTEKDDYRLIALNKISKNFDNNHPIDEVKNSYRPLLHRFGNSSVQEEFDKLTDFNNMSNELKKNLVFAWEKKLYYATKEQRYPNERILLVKLKDIINNKNKVLQDLANFTNSEINDTSVVFYKQYLESQKKVWDYVNN